MKERHELRRARWLALAAGAVAAGCGADPSSLPDGGVAADAGAADASSADAAPPPDAELSGGEPAYATTQDVQRTAVRGGSGGDPFQLICPTGFLAVGIEGRTGSRLDRISVMCRELLEDGTLGDEVAATAAAGGDGGSAFEVECPEGEAIVALRGRESSGDIHAVGIDCAPVGPWVDEGRGHERGEELHGGSGGDAFFDLCSRGFFVAELSGQHASIIHGLRARCVRVEDENDRTPPGEYERGTRIEELPPRGGTDQRTVRIDCKDDELPIGYLGRSGSRVDRIQFICGRLAADGTLAESGTSIPAGGTGGEEFREDCPENEAIVGLRGRAGRELDAIGLVCAPVAGYLADDTGVHPWGRLHGGSGGDAFEDICPAGMFLRDLRAFPDDVIEAITGTCVEVRAL